MTQGAVEMTQGKVEMTIFKGLLKELCKASYYALERFGNSQRRWPVFIFRNLR